jgi:hypothetical protein
VSVRILAVTATVMMIVTLCPVALHAGGPAFVAGSGYNPGVEGQPLVWAGGSVQYFTDQGDLSLILPGPQADAFVAAAIVPWITAPGVLLTATQAGHLAEDVNGSNIQATVAGVITAPADITPSATGTPLGVVYDFDGTVTDAVLGQGAGDLDQCFSNAVYGGPDNFSPGGNIVHAVVIINGVCASTSAQLPDVQYRLVRVLGRIFGLGWSQANVNVQTGNPAPTSDDYAGFPVMHFTDSISCVPISVCYPNAAVPKMDDVTALARFYPAPGGNPQPAGRVYGNLYFTDSSGNATQQMQGVNVVARLIVSGAPSGRYVVTSVSGFEFVGNAGNIITGYLDPNGLRFDRFGSSDTSLEGFFDLGELMIPTGQNVAEYQLSIEPLDPNWSLGVEPYGPTQVVPSGSFAPVVVTVAPASNSERDILMLGSEIPQPHPGTGSTYANPAPLPQGGGWGSWLSGYGGSDWFEFTALANRTASIAVTALDETGNPTESKLLPIIGVWELSDQTGDPAPASTPSAFNSQTFGMSRLDVQFTSPEAYRVGIADYRGDGRPDYSYQASVLYSNSATPPRLSVAGGVTTLQGIGFRSGLQVSAAGAPGRVLSQSATELQVALPAAVLDGTATIQVTDPLSGSFSQMFGALTYGAAPTDLLLLLQGSEPSTPVGSQAANMIRLRATASDGLTPVNGATIVWSATNGVQFSACNGATSCSVLSDDVGEASTWVTPIVTGPSTITAALAPQSYPQPQTEQATLVGTSTTLDLAAVAPTRWIAQGATMSVPITVEALDLGVPKANVAISYTVTQGAASLSSGSATTNAAGQATVAAQVTNLSATVQVSACVAPGNNPCQTFTLFAVASSSWTLETVAGSLQVVPNGQPFQPLVMRATDGSVADNPVLGVAVSFSTTLERYQEGGAPVILGTSQAQAVTDQNGLASIVPTVGSLGPCEIYIVVTAAGLTVQIELESTDPIASGQLPPKQRNKVRVPERKPDVDATAQPAPPTAATGFFAVPEALPAPSDPLVNPPDDPPGYPSRDPSNDPHSDPLSDPSASPATAPPLPSACPPADQSSGKSSPAVANFPLAASETISAPANLESASTRVSASQLCTFTKSPLAKPSGPNPAITPASVPASISVAKPDRTPNDERTNNDRTNNDRADKRTCRFSQQDEALP